MGVISAAVRELMAAGLSGDALFDALDRIESQDASRRPDAAAERRRTADRERKRRLRNSAESAENVDADAECPRNSAESADTASARISGSSSTLELTGVISGKENPPKGGQKKGAGREDFDAFMQAYPIRKGSKATEAAWLKFDKTVRDGADPQSLIAAAKRFAAEELRLGHVDTPFVPQAKAWLHQGGWRDYLTDTPEPPPGPKPPHPDMVQVRAAGGKMTWCFRGQEEIYRGAFVN